MTRAQLGARFVKLPIKVLDDESLSARAVRVFAIMLDASRGDCSTISLRRIGERLGRKRDAARGPVRELIAAGHIRALHVENGKCPIYEIITRCERTGSETPTGAIPTSSKNASDPLQKANGTGSETPTVPILSSLDLSLAASACEKDIKKDDDQAKLRGDALIFLKAMGVNAKDRDNFIASNVSLVGRWYQVDWSRDYPGVRKRGGFLTKKLRAGEEPELNLPEASEPTESINQLSPQNLAIAQAAWEVMQHRCPQGFERLVSDGLIALEDLSKKTTPEEIKRLLAFADSLECRNTPYEGIRSIQYLAQNWCGLKARYGKTLQGKPRRFRLKAANFKPLTPGYRVANSVYRGCKISRNAPANFLQRAA